MASAEDARGNKPVERDFKKIGKNHLEEIKILNDNIENILRALSLNPDPMPLKSKEFRHETGGIWAICVQRRNLMTLRLYVYLDQDECVLLLLCLGGKQNKREQNADIQQAKTLLKRYCPEEE